MFLGEIEEILDVIEPTQFVKIQEHLFRLAFFIVYLIAPVYVTTWLILDICRLIFEVIPDWICFSTDKSPGAFQVPISRYAKSYHG